MTTKRLRGPVARRFAGLVAGLGILVAAFAVGPTEAAFARTWAGGVVVEEVCPHQYGSEWKTVLTGGSAFDWWCVNTTRPADPLRPVDMNFYCNWKYGGAYADPQGGGAYDWGCYWA